MNRCLRSDSSAALPHDPPAALHQFLCDGCGVRGGLVPALGHVRIWRVGLRVGDLELRAGDGRAEGFGLRIGGLRFRVWVLECRVYGVGCRL